MMGRPAQTCGLHGNWSESGPQICPSAPLDACAHAAVCLPSTEEQGTQAMALGRGEGRISRRRKRQQAMKVREQAKRAVKVCVCPVESCLRF